MILLLGGTTEGRKLYEWLDAQHIPYLYSTKTPATFLGKGSYRHGPLTEENLLGVCDKYKVRLVLNAAHPFATQLHRLLASQLAHLTLLRYERPTLPRMADPLVHYVKNYQEVLKKLTPFRSLLALTGVQSIPELKPFWTTKPCFIRIMDKSSSRILAEKHHFPKKNLLFGKPQSVAKETALIKKLRVQAVLTKESGALGGLNRKIQSAQRTTTPLFVLERPSLPSSFRLIHNLTSLRPWLKHL